MKEIYFMKRAADALEIFCPEELLRGASALKSAGLRASA